MNNSASFSDLNKKDRVDFYIALVTICCTLFFILFYSFGFSSDDSSKGFLNSSFSDTQLDDAIVVDEVEYVPFQQPIISRAKEQKPEKIYSVFPLIMTDSIVNTNHRKGLNSDIQNDEVELNESQSILDTDKHSISLDSVIVKNAIVNADSVSVLHSDTIEVEKKSIQKVSDFTKESNVKVSKEIDKSCIIAVGLYANSSNADRMFKRLELGGFDPIIRQRGSRYQVLIYHACNAVTINNSLDIIKSKYASDAVVLIRK